LSFCYCSLAKPPCSYKTDWDLGLSTNNKGPLGLNVQRSFCISNSISYDVFYLVFLNFSFAISYNWFVLSKFRGVVTDDVRYLDISAYSKSELSSKVLSFEYVLLIFLAPVGKGLSYIFKRLLYSAMIRTLFLSILGALTCLVSIAFAFLRVSVFC